MITTTRQVDDRILDELVDEICARLHQGEPIDIDRLATEHPVHAESLRKLYPTLLAITSLEGTAEPGVTLPEARQQILGDFRIIRQIGRGGMGVVYEAEQLSIPRRVALKVLPLASLVDPRALQRFRNEVAAIATLEHPHIVSVYAVGEERGIHYYAMKLIDGQSLATVIKELRARADRDEKLSGDAIQQAVSDASISSSASAPLAGEGLGEGETVTREQERKNEQHEHEYEHEYEHEKQGEHSSVPSPSRGEGQDEHSAPSPPFRGRGQGEGDIETVARGRSNTVRRVADPAYFRNVATLICQAAEALQHAHDHGIIHRDIKPGNLLLDTSGTLFVTDFGLARIETGAGVTMTGDVLGTLRYMSPEQVLANRVIIDHRTDIYSLGATLYELLTLQPMWIGDDKAEIIRQISFDEPTPPQKLNPAIPTDLETIVLKALSKNPDERYATAQAFADDVRSYVELKPIVAKRPNLVQCLNKWARRNPSLLFASFGTLAILVVSLTIGVIGLIASNRMIQDREAAKQKALEEVEKQRRLAVLAEAKATTRANELKQVSEFQSAILDDINLADAGIELLKNAKEQFETVIAGQDMPLAERDEIQRTFAENLAYLNGTDLARAFVDANILQPTLKMLDDQFNRQPLVDAELRQSLAKHFADIRRTDLAVPLQQRVIATRRELLGGEDRETLEAIVNMSDIMWNSAKYREEGFQLLLQHLDTMRRVLGNEDRLTLMAVSGIGTSYLDKGEKERAEAFLNEAVDTFRRVFGDADRGTIAAINSLTVLRLNQQNFEAALSLAVPNLENSRKALGDAHEITLMVSGWIQLIHYVEGRIDEAIQNQRSILEAHRVRFGIHDPRTAIAEGIYANLLAKSGQLELAEQHYSSALSELSFNFNRLSMVLSLGEIHRLGNRLKEAEACFREILESSDKRVRDLVRLKVMAGKNLAEMLDESGRTEEAEQLFLTALAAEGKEVPTGESSVVSAKVGLARLRLSQNRCEEALTILESSEAGAENHPKGRVPWQGGAGRVLLTLGEARLASKSFAKAEANLLRAFELLDTAYFPESQEAVDCASVLVELYEHWHGAEPDAGYDLKGSEWAERLPALRSKHLLPQTKQPGG